MDFQFVAGSVLRTLVDRDVDFALMGGFALGFHGVTRATSDMDFLLLLDDVSRAEAVLDEFGYRSFFKSENVEQFSHVDARYGTIDFVFAFREISRKMLGRATWVAISETLSVKCLSLEDIIGLKLQALVNDPARELRDRADMESLVAAAKQQGRAIDWDLLGDYFRLFERDNVLAELRHLHDQT